MAAILDKGVEWLVCVPHLWERHPFGANAFFSELHRFKWQAPSASSKILTVQSFVLPPTLLHACKFVVGVSYMIDEVPNLRRVWPSAAAERNGLRCRIKDRQNEGYNAGRVGRLS